MIVEMNVQEVMETEISNELAMRITPVVSVLMTAYNHEKYIAEAIEGVLAQQTDFPFELIIGEDCSSDNTRSIVLDYQKRYPNIIRILFSDRNISAFHNSNRIFKKARGEFVAYCEGDDYWHDKRKLNKQVDYMRNHLDVSLIHSDYDWLIHSFGSWRVIKAWNRRRRRVVPEGDVFASLLTDMFVRTCTMMGRRALLKEHYDSMFRTLKNPVGDWPIVLHMAWLGNVGYIDESLATYRRSMGSMTNIGGYSNYLWLHKRKPDMYGILEEFKPLTEGQKKKIEIALARELVFSTYEAGAAEEFKIAYGQLKTSEPTSSREWKIIMRRVIVVLGGFYPAILRITKMYREFKLYTKSTARAHT